MSSPAVFSLLINLLVLMKGCLCQLHGDATPPCMCTMEFEPVCGADGKTYGNRCDLACRGVRWMKDGECRQSGSKHANVGISIPGAGRSTKHGSEKDAFNVEHKIDPGTKSKSLHENEEYGVEYKFDPGTKPGSEKGEIGVKTYGPGLHQGTSPHL